MSLSGDIYGICEIIEFAGIAYSEDGNIDFNNKLRHYLQKCVSSDNFQNTVFLSLNFFQQYQIMKYLNDKYNVKITFKSHDDDEDTAMKNVLKKQINSKEFEYFFKNDAKLLELYVKDCFKSDERKLFWEYGVTGNNVDCVYPVYLENICDEPMNSLNDMIVARDLKNTSNELLLTLINIIETKLDSSNKSNIIRGLSFTGSISKEKCNVLIEKGYSDETIEHYFAYRFEPVMLYCICFV